jgi:hypothetical protein
MRGYIWQRLRNWRLKEFEWRKKQSRCLKRGCGNLKKRLKERQKKNQKSLRQPFKEH